MKCKCGNEMNIKMGSKLIVKGCEVLTAMTVVITAKCNQCGEMFQVPITNNSAIVKSNDN